MAPPTVQSRELPDVPPPESFGEVIFTDNFDDGDFSDWSIERNENWHNPSEPCKLKDDPTTWQLIDGWMQIEILSYEGICHTEIIADSVDISGLDYYEYSVDMRFEDRMQMDRNVLFGWQDAENWYDLKILGEKILVEKVIENEWIPLPSNWALYPFELGNSYRITVRVSPERILTFVNDELVLQTLKEGPEIEGIDSVGLKASVGAIAHSVNYFDNLSVRALPAPAGATSLGVELLKQTDPRWGSDLYDSADQWSDRHGIDAWGCTMTSMTMIMRHHGLTQMPSGGEVLPDSVNTWLRSQPDGYVGGGLVNWMAMTRLTRLISEAHGTPKLEYRRLGGGLDPAMQEVEAERPSILQIAGHFLVADGITEDGDDLLIKDPFYDYPTFSQHNTELLSTRQLMPSQTDLSYLLAVAPPEISMRLLDSAGEVIAQDFREVVIVPDDPNRRSDSRMLELPKPAAGVYELELTAPLPMQKSIQFLSYDERAEVEMETRELALDATPLRLQWEYLEDGSSEIRRVASFAEVVEVLDGVYGSGALARRSTWQDLRRTAQIGAKTDPTATGMRSRLLQKLRSDAASSREDFDDLAWQRLHSTLEAVSP
jgi:hypothetical protein